MEFSFKLSNTFLESNLTSCAGIPYASPPVGRLRFMPPVTPPTWTTTRSATTFGPVCPQRLADISNETEALGRMTRGRLKLLRRLYPLLANQSEDCLYLNIYTVASGRFLFCFCFVLVMKGLESFF